jgi:sugar-specific transcriptional regulator TrmB
LFNDNLKPRGNEGTKVESSANYDSAIDKMKEVIDKTNDVICLVLSKNLSPVITKVSLIYLVNVIDDNRQLVNLVLDLLIKADTKTRHWALYETESNDDNGEGEARMFYFKTTNSLAYPCHLNRKLLIESANDLMSELANKLAVVKGPHHD